MRAGQLRHSVTIQQRTIGPDSVGSISEGWADLYTTRAAIYPLSARERVDNGQKEQLVTHRVQFRYLAGVTADMRVVFGSRVLRIVGVINVGEQNRKLELTCEELG